VVGTLYVLGVLDGDPADVTFRARRILEEVALVVADHVDSARHLLAQLGVPTPLAAAGSSGSPVVTLGEGDVALLTGAWSLAPSGAEERLVREAIARGHPVVPVPGPALPVTALVLAGLPADSFLYLGELPAPGAARHELLGSLALERRTIVVVASAPDLADALLVLGELPGERPLVAVAVSNGAADVVWRGVAARAPDLMQDWPARERYVLVVGGAREQVSRWDEDRLRSQVRARLALGLGVKEVSRQLAAESGWPRRAIYRLAVDITRLLPGKPS